MKIHHIGFLAVDGQATVNEYLTIGAEIEQAEKLDPSRKIKITFLKLDGYRIEVIEPIDNESPFYPLLRRFKNAPYHTCYEVNDLEASLEVFKQKGYLVTSLPQEAPCLDGRKVAFLMSEHMGIIELLEV